MKIENKLPGIQRNVLLKNYTTFRIGGLAKYFFVAKNKKDLIKAISVAKKLKLPFFILGGGSNLLVSDKGYNGILIKIRNTKYEIRNTKIMAEAGVMLGELVNILAKAGLSGLEWAAGIPGTIGGAIRGNAGAFNKSMKDVVKSVEALEVKNEKCKVKNFKNRDCKFSYRDSIFKDKKNQSTKQSFVLGRAHKIMCSDLIILSAVLQLKKGKKSEIEKKVKENLNYRKERQPLNFPSAGSVFKNPCLTGRQALGFSAGELIERCGLKGKKIGNVKISEIHSNFIVNLGNGKAKDVIKLIKLIKQKVKKKFGVVLEEEIQYLQ